MKGKYVKEAKELYVTVVPRSQFMQTVLRNVQFWEISWIDKFAAGSHTIKQSTNHVYSLLHRTLLFQK